MRPAPAVPPLLPLSPKAAVQESLCHSTEAPGVAVQSMSSVLCSKGCGTQRTAWGHKAASFLYFTAGHLGGSWEGGSLREASHLDGAHTSKNGTRPLCSLCSTLPLCRSQGVLLTSWFWTPKPQPRRPLVPLLQGQTRQHLIQSACVPFSPPVQVTFVSCCLVVTFVAHGHLA